MTKALTTFFLLPLYVEKIKNSLEVSIKFYNQKYPTVQSHYALNRDAGTKLYDLPTLSFRQKAG